MCGLAGLYNPHGSVASVSILEDMTLKMHHQEVTSLGIWC